MIRLKSQQVQLSLAWIVSLGVHALFVLLLLELYSELRQPRRPVLLVSHDNSRFVVLPDLAVRLDGAPNARVAADARRRPSEVAASAPWRGLASDQLLAMQPRSEATIHSVSPSPMRPRERASSALPVEVVAVPASPAAPVTSSSDSLVLTPAVTPLPRSSISGTSDWRPEVSERPPRIASLPSAGDVRRPSSRLFLESTVVPDSRDSLTRRPSPAFAHRFGRRRTDDERDLAIERGLAFLARVQLEDGRWQFRKLRDRIDPYAETPSPRADAAATGLALLAFLGAGRDHLDVRYHRVVDDGLQFLIRSQQPHGEFFAEDWPGAGQLTRFYSHGIATLALCEAFGMTGDDRLRKPAQRALDYLAGAHHNAPDAWRILPGSDADSASISWQLATLRCGQLAGLHVDPVTMESAKAYVVKCREEERAANATATAVDLAMKLRLGGSRDDARLRPAAETLLAHPPELADEPAAGAKPGELPAENSRRDTYYWYYGSEAMFSLGGNDWQNWSRQLYPQLIKTQVRDGRFAGSWDAKINQSTTMAGRLYVTAMNLLSLEIENRQLRAGDAVATEAAERDEALKR